MSDEKTNAEFITECEAFITSESEHGYYGEPAYLGEALERLKHGDKELKMLTNEAYGHALIVGEQIEQIAELKGLLRWCRSEANFAHCDDTAIARIDELVKE